MRFRLPILFTACGLAALLFAGCSTARPISDAIKAAGMPADLSGCAAEVRYLSDSKGSNYLHVDFAGGDALAQSVISAVRGSKPTKAPENKSFVPQQSDCELIFSAQDKKLSLYYSKQYDLLIYTQSTKDKQGETVQYRYYTPQEGLGALLDQQKQTAVLIKQDDVKPFRNMEELKSSIDAEELAEQGTELEFEFFDGTIPASASTACRVYTHADTAAVPADSYLITTYGKDKTGKQIKLSITGIDANSNYTKVIVMPPDDALDSVNTGDAPVSNAATIKLAAVDPAKWIVFVDEDNNIYDVILPEDIVQLSGTVVSAAPSGSPGISPAASASGSAAVTAVPSASPAATEEPPEGDND